MWILSIPTCSGQKRLKEANKSKYELYSNAIKASIDPVIH